VGLALSCPRCGAPIRGDDEDDLLAQVERHVEQEHPGLVGRWSDDELLDLTLPEYALSVGGVRIPACT
jgi:predicted small metal-binding protein